MGHRGRSFAIGASGKSLHASLIAEVASNHRETIADQFEHAIVESIRLTFGATRLPCAEHARR